MLFWDGSYRCNILAAQPILGNSLGADICFTQHHDAHELLSAAPLSIHTSDMCSIIETQARFSGGGEVSTELEAKGPQMLFLTMNSESS